MTPPTVVDVASPTVNLLDPSVIVEPDTAESEPMTSESVSFKSDPVAVKLTDTLFASACPFESLRLPALTLTDPVNVFVPDNVNSPEPTLMTSSPLATPFWITPLNTVDALFPPTVIVKLPSPLLLTTPVPAIEAIV
jgi:hypothetical protein